MFRYLRAAFTARPHVPGLGAVPLNVLGVAGFAVLGLANPAFWALGLGLETAYLFALGSNRRFRAVVDARGVAAAPARGGGREWEDLVEGLGGESRTRLSALNGELKRVLSLYDRFRVDDLTVSHNRESLLSLLGHYARFLAARESIELHWTDDAGKLGDEAGQIRRELEGGDLTEELRVSKTRTLEILAARMENQKRREEMREELESELRRIEAQFDLALENAAMSSTPQAISPDLAIDLQRLEGVLSAQAGERREAKREGPSRGRRRRRERD